MDSGKPTEYVWATDANYTVDGDPWGGDPTKVDPGATRRAEGAEPDTFPAEWFNYHMASIAEGIDFIYALLRGEEEYGTDLVSKDVPANALAHTTGWTLTSNTTGDLVTTANSALAVLNLARLLPDKAELEQVDVMYTPGASRSGGNLHKIDLWDRELDWTTPASPAMTVVQTEPGLTGTAIHVFSMLSIGLTIDCTRQQALQIQAGNTAGGSPDTLHGIRLWFNDPGPRNL